MEKEEDLENSTKQVLTIPLVNNIYCVIVNNNKILSYHRTKESAEKRKNEWLISEFEGVFSIERIELED